jgi:hypothetical protein
MDEIGNQLISRSWCHNMAGSHTGRSHTNRLPGGIGIDLGECSCSHTNDFLGHAVYGLCIEEISEMGRIMMKNAIV